MHCSCVILVTTMVIWSVYSMPMPTPASDTMAMEAIEHYFMKYHYMADGMPDKKIADMYYSNKSMAFQKAAEIFQRRYSQFGLSVTGQLDQPTLNLMKKPRCGVADINTMNDMMEMRRKRRYLDSGAKWSKTDLTYRISLYTHDPGMSRSVVDREIRRAFNVWENVSPLRFSVYNPQIHNGLDIDIQFVPSIRDHGDGYPFDGVGGTLAHAFFPQSGKIGGDSHFDEAETWTVNTHSGINLFQVAAHEFGHALGLGHSMDPTALMAPFYQGYLPNFSLPQDDINGIQAIYGRPISQTTTTTTTPAPPPSTMSPVAPDVCRTGKFDAIATIKHSSGYKTYGFQDDQYFLIKQAANGARSIAEGYPRKISQGWRGLPDNIDAALFWDEVVEDGQKLPAVTFVFKGSQYWVVEDMKVLVGPSPISQWGLTGAIDASLIWKRNGKTYFFKGDQYYRYTENQGIDPGYPRNISAWRGLPARGVDAAIQYTDGRTYFFKDSKHYLFNDDRVQVENGYPRCNKQHWLGCYRSDRNIPNRRGPHRGHRRGPHRRPSRFD